MEDWKKKLDKLLKDPTYSIFAWIAMCLVGLIIIWAVLASFGPITTKPLKVPSFGELLARNKTQPKPQPTLADILCSYMFKYNITNMTFGNTTCYKDTYCVCIEPI